MSSLCAGEPPAGLAVVCSELRARKAVKFGSNCAHAVCCRQAFSGPVWQISVYYNAAQKCTWAVDVQRYCSCARCAKGSVDVLFVAVKEDRRVTPPLHRPRALQHAMELDHRHEWACLGWWQRLEAYELPTA